MRALAGCTVLSVALTLLAVPAAAQVNVTGQWSMLSQTMPINPIHVGLMRTGKILVVSGSQNDPTVTTYSAAVYDPNTGAISVQTIPWDLFCNGLSFMPDGRALIAGGNLQYNPFRGIRTATVFDPVTEKFAQVQDMARGRWYPSVVGLPDGRMATFSGWLEGGGTNNAVEIYTNPSGWSPENVAPFVPPLYPWLHLLPDGRVFQSGASVASQIFNPSTGQWQTNVATMNYPRDRIYGSSVLLPLSAADNWRARIMVMGGDNPATATAEIIDLSQANPRWQTTNSMSAPRIQMDAVILPTGKVLALGGSAQNNTASTASLNADLFDPATGTWSPAGTMNLPRMYHSVALLLPDGTVWSAGSNPNQGSYEQRMEIYRPAYLFNASGGAAARPAITGAPGAVGYGGSFTVTTPNAANIASVALIRNGANTHAFDMDQRMVSLAFTRGSGSLTVTAPPNANIAPPGYYMLFIVDSNGVPSVARFVQMSANPGNQPPRGSIDAPSGDITVTAGSMVTFAGSATDADGSVSAYRWIIPGGTPSTSTSQNPGSVQFSTPGSYHVSLTVTDNQGATDPSPPMRVITVTSGTLAAAFTSPADGATVSGTVNVGMSASGASGSSNTFTLTLDGTQIFSTTTSSTTAIFAWNTTLTGDGAHTLGLSVRDATGATATATRTVTVNNNTPPGTLNVSFPNLTPGQGVQGTVPVQIAVSGASGSSNRFTVFVDNVQQTTIVSNATTVTWNWDTSTFSNGSHTISAQVQDATGHTGSGFVYVQVQNASFQVFVTQPASGATVSGMVNTTIWLQGAAAGTKTFTITVAGQVLSTGTDTSSGPVTMFWDSTRVANGSQTMIVSVRDPAGANGSIGVPVVVQNAGGGPGPLTAGFSSPASGATVSGTVTVGMTASGGTAPYTFTLAIDGAQVASGASASFSWNTTTVADGGHTLGLTVRDNSGATATASRSVTVQNGGGGGGTASIALSFNGKLRDRVGADNVAPAPDGAVDGTLTMTLSAAGGRTVTSLRLQNDGGGTWDTTASTGSWILGAAASLDGPLLNNASTAAVNVPVADGGSLVIFGSDYSAGAGFAQGRVLTLTATFSDGSSAQASTTVAGGGGGGGGGTPAITLAFNGKLRDRVGADSSALAPDGALDGTLSMTLSAAGGRTVTSLRLQNDVNGTWDTAASTGFWVLGAAASLDGPLLNNSTTMALNVAVADGGSLVVFASDYGAGAGFAPGRVLTLTAIFSDGSTAQASATVGGGGPAPLAAGFSAPAAGSTVSGTVTVSMTASGGTAPYTYTLTIDGTQVASSGAASFSWNTTGYADGSHTLGLTVRDSTGATATASRSVTVQNSTGGGGTLAVAVTTPSPGQTVSGVVWFTVWVDNAAAGSKTYTVVADGSPVFTGTSSDRPASIPWVTTNGTNGTKTVVVNVRDSAGATGSSPAMALTVNNP